MTQANNGKVALVLDRQEVGVLYDVLAARGHVAINAVVNHSGPEIWSEPDAATFREILSGAPAYVEKLIKQLERVLDASEAEVGGEAPPSPLRVSFVGDVLDQEEFEIIEETMDLYRCLALDLVERRISDGSLTKRDAKAYVQSIIGKIETAIQISQGKVHDEEPLESLVDLFIASVVVPWFGADSEPRDVAEVLRGTANRLDKPRPLRVSLVDAMGRSWEVGCNPPLSVGGLLGAAAGLLDEGPLIQN